MIDGFVYFPPSVETNWACLDEFHEKNLERKEKQIDICMLEKWAKTTGEIVSKLVKEKRAQGFVFSPFPKKLVSGPELYERWLTAYDISIKSSSTTRWADELGLPESYERTKTGVNEAWLENRVSIEKLLTAADEIYVRLAQGKMDFSFLLFVHGKDEPVTEKKFLDARHRTIVAPDWAVQLVDIKLSLMTRVENGKREWCTFDEIVAENNFFRSKGENFWASGGDILGELPFVTEMLPKGKIVDYDVKGWETTVPSRVSYELYRQSIGFAGETDHSTCLDAIAKKLNEQLNGQALYRVTGDYGFYRLPHMMMWSSGQMRTLCGNSIMHAALLKIHGWKGIVQGDDANVVCGGKEEVETSYRKLGIELKECVELDHVNFCSCEIKEGKPIVNVRKIFAKMYSSTQTDCEMGLKIPALAFYWLRYSDIPRDEIHELLKPGSVLGEMFDTSVKRVKEMKIF